MIKRLTLLVLALMLSLTLTACSTAPVAEPPEQPQTITVTDDMGRTVTLEKIPERIISLAPSSTEFLFALGLGAKVVGATDFCDYPVEALEVERVGGFADISIEKIVSLQPDLVLVASLHKAEAEQLELVGIPVIALNANSLDEVLANATLLGQATGTEQAAAALVQSMQDIIAQVDAKTTQLTPEERPLVYYEIWFDPIMAAGPDTFLDELIVRAGGTNIAAGAPTSYPVFSLEELLAKQPEIMFYGHAMESVEDIRNRPNWGTIPAITDDRVYLVDQNIMLRPGPRLAEALQELARHIHPELWQK